MVPTKTRVAFSNLDRILYPELGISKKEVIEYYIRKAPLMIPLLEERPLTIRRFPNGIGEEGFFQKDVPRNAPEWVRTYTMESGGDATEYIICNDLDTLMWLANLAAIEIHIPLARVPSVDKPDLALFDIDPEPPATFRDACRVAGFLKKLLDELGILSFLKTSGKKGIHVVVPIERRYAFRQVRDFVHGVGMLLEGEHKEVRAEFADSREPGTVFVDYLQNSRGKTMVSPYSLRPEPAATVSAPLEWGELSGEIRPEDFNIATIISRKEDPWKDIFKNPQEIVVKWDESKKDRPGNGITPSLLDRHHQYRSCEHTGKARYHDTGPVGFIPSSPPEG
jgi:bifunctional non-homologous end joining protein LigD